MCVIIKVEANKSLPRDVLKNCYDNNPDGYGMMVAEKDGLHYYKDVKSFDDFYRVWRSFNRSRPRAIHFRRKTHGKINKENCHPFFTAHGELGFMHNGVINGVPEVHKDMNDTYNFMMQEIYPFVDKYPDIVNEPKFYEWMERITGTNKFLFLTRDGNYHMTNATLWHNHLGVVFSNAHSHTEPYRAQAYSHARSTGVVTPKGRTEVNYSHDKNDHAFDDYGLWDFNRPETSAVSQEYKYTGNIDRWEQSLKDAQRTVAAAEELDKSSEDALEVANKACQGIVERLKSGAACLVRDGVVQPVPTTVYPQRPTIVSEVGSVVETEEEREEEEEFPLFPSETELGAMTEDQIADYIESNPEAAAKVVMMLMGRV